MNNKSMLLYNSNNLLEYLDLLKKNKIYFNYIFIYGGKKTINYPYCRKILFFKQHKLDTFIRKKIINLREKNIFSFVKEGEIIKKKFFKNLNLYHAHPGFLPNFKGSTTFYFQKIEKNFISISIFKIKEKIDTGKIIYVKHYKNYKNALVSIPKLRMLTRINFFKEKKKLKYPNNSKTKFYYFRAHPLVRYIAKIKK